MKHLSVLFLIVASQAYGQHGSATSPHSASMARVETFATVDGRPFFPKQYTDVNGTPNLFDDWTVSTITLNDGKVINNIKTNFNLVTDELLYVDEKGQPMVASPSVIKMVVADDRTFITTDAKNTFVEVLSTQGKAVLLRHRKKVIVETKPYNSATIQKDFRTKEDVIVVANGNSTEVNSASDLYEALGSSDQLKDFAKKEKLKPRSIDSWAKIVDFYNSI